jgi:enoyl-[acyl-carrier protein] reductase/trans-2-enoyl-CoA reductase (NAD+)
MNAHPEGLRRYVSDHIAYVREKGGFQGPKNVLIIGSSAGYGLATRIACAYGAGAKTLGVAFEKPASAKRTATVGWYNTHAFEEQAHADGLVAETFFADAFSHETRAKVITRIRELMGKVDLVVYSLASGVRTDPDTGEQWRSALKPIGNTYRSRAVDAMKGEVHEVEIEPAGEEETFATVKVMGGEDWELWIDALLEAQVLAPGALTLAYSYIGPEVTQAVYRDGTIGKAKEHLEATSGALNAKLAAIEGKAFVSVNKALVTRASSVIPAVPLYLSILFRVMKEKNIHEDTIAQMYRLFTERLYAGGEVPVDELGRIRLDDWEMREDVQAEVAQIWPEVTTENIASMTDIEGFRSDFLHIHGFGYDSVDYDADIEP